MGGWRTDRTVLVGPLAEANRIEPAKNRSVNSISGIGPLGTINRKFFVTSLLSWPSSLLANISTWQRMI